MAIIATGSKTIIDLSDGKSLSVYLGANQPRTQIHDVNASTYSPDWTTTAGKLTVTPVVYANQTAIALNNTALTITWKRKDGSAAEAALISGETVSGKALTVNKNNLATATSKQLTYIAYVAYADPDTGLTINATADIAIQIEIENHLDRFRLFRVDYQVSVLIPIVSQKLWGKKQTPLESAIHRPVHDDRLGV